MNSKINITNKKDCCGCGACGDVCPHKYIQMVEDQEGFRYPQINERQCVDCGLCNQVCPVQQTGHDKCSGIPLAYAIKNKHDLIRCESSSGGVFSLLAEEILSSGGIVIGAAFAEDWRSVRHIIIETPQEIYKMRGSKYLQSNVCEVYGVAKKTLKEGRRVLFSGTPCQCEALLTFLGKKDDNLLLVDIICHGVPSPKLWRKYLDFRQGEHSGKLSSVCFRDKRTSWHDYDVVLQFGAEEYRCTNREDPYMRMFQQDLSLRPSCHECRFKNLYRLSDLTLADFWGIDYIVPDMNDDRGVSLVFVHTNFGSEILVSLSEKIEYVQVDAVQASSYNQAMTQSYPAHPKRDEFFECMDDLSFIALYNRFAKPKLTIKRIIKAVLRRIGLLDVIQKMRK